jgi:hypothetical protein
MFLDSYGVLYIITKLFYNVHVYIIIIVHRHIHLVHKLLKLDYKKIIKQLTSFTICLYICLKRNEFVKDAYISGSWEPQTSDVLMLILLFKTSHVTRLSLQICNTNIASRTSKTLKYIINMLKMLGM